MPGDAKTEMKPAPKETAKEKRDGTCPNSLGAPVAGSAPRRRGVHVPRMAGQAHGEVEGMRGQHQRGEQ
eukprot:12905540-Prorocentrum_lima.AAC.1